MAQKVEVKYFSDLSEAEAQESVNFALDGTEYEIDLTTKEAQSLRKGLDKYVKAGRKVGGRGRQKKSASSNGGPSASEVREWARGQGFQVTDRGRIPNDVMEKFKAAH